MSALQAAVCDMRLDVCRNKYGEYFGITVAGYPEAHPDAIVSDPAEMDKVYWNDLHYLKEKVWHDLVCMLQAHWCAYLWLSALSRGHVLPVIRQQCVQVLGHVSNRRMPATVAQEAACMEG